MNAARSHGKAEDFVVRDGSVHWEDDRRDFRRRTKPEVNPRDIACGGALLQQLDDPAADAYRGLARIVASPTRKGCGIEQEQEVDVGGIVQLTAAELAHRNDGEPGRISARRALLYGGFQRKADRAIGEVGQQRRHSLERKLTRQVAERGCQRQAVALPPELVLEIFDRICRCQSGRCSGICAILPEAFGDFRQGKQRLAKKRRKAFRPPDRIEPRFALCV